MDRPSTSKARGICRYYQYPRGCFAGDGCKFLHGDPKVDKGTNARLTPYDQAKTCRYFAKGFCKHGDKCWFRHITPKPVDTAAEIDPADEACSICFENPPVYGLLAGCSHVFCISCLKEWRDPKAKSADVVQSGVHKKCPMCRAPSKFIIPSSLFYKQGDPQKEQTITAYKDSMAKVPCRYFVQSRARNKDQPFCPFGKDCFYRHSNEDGSMYVFTDGVDVSMRRASEFRERRQMDATDSLFSDLFAGVNDGSIRNPFDVFSRFLQDSQLADAFSDLFQGLVRDPPADTRDRNPRSPPARPAVSTIFDTEIMPDRPIDSWSLDGHLDTTSGVRVTIHGLEDLNMPSSTPPRESSPSSPPSDPSDNINHGADDDGHLTDGSIPPLHNVSDSDDSSPSWSDDGDSEDDHLDNPRVFHADALSPPSPPPAGPSPAYSFGRYPRVVFNSTGGFRLSDNTTTHNPFSPPQQLTPPPNSDRLVQAFAEQLAANVLAERAETDLGATSTHVRSTTTSMPTHTSGPNEDDIPSLQLFADLDPEEDGDDEYEYDDDDDLPALECITPPSALASTSSTDSDSESRQLTVQKSPILTEDLAAAASENSAEEHEVSPRPFTTDGRGRVIAASDEDNGVSDGRSFFSRVFDVLF